MKRRPRRFTKHWLEAVQLSQAGMAMQASSCSEGETVTLKSVTFSNGLQIKKDTQNAYYDPPEWTPAEAKPYLYVKGQELKVFPVWDIVGTPPANTAKIRGNYNLGPSAYEYIAEANAAVVAGNKLQPGGPISGSAAFKNRNSTAFYNPFTICWEISWDGGTTWLPAGGSYNPVYVCLVTPIQSVALHHTVVHLACSNPGATNAATAAANTWALFVAKAIKRAQDGLPLYYYKPGTTFADNAKGPAFNLLSSDNQSGECSTWANLLRDAWRINGISITSYVEAKPDNNGLFWVKQWSAVPASGSFYFQSAIIDMKPYPPNGSGGTDKYGYYDNGSRTQFKNDTILQGQNSAGDAPAEKAFNEHHLLKYDGNYYDPSYGVMYTGANKNACETNFQNAVIEGVGVFAAVVGGKRVYNFTKVSPGTTVVNFSS